MSNSSYNWQHDLLSNQAPAFWVLASWHTNYKTQVKRMIVRAIQFYNDNQDRFSVPILVEFMVPACNLPWQPGTKTVDATVPHMRSSAVVQPTSQPYVGKNWQSSLLPVKLKIKDFLEGAKHLLLKNVICPCMMAVLEVNRIVGWTSLTTIVTEQ
jgi:hypothetical protein